MKLFARIAAGGAALAVMALGTGLVVAGPSDGPTAGASKVQPNKLTGKWTGQWKNKTFGSKGAVRGTVNKKGKKLTFAWDFDGTVFACPDPANEKASAKKGGKGSSYDKKKIKVVDKSEAFGALKVTYKDKTDKIKGAGDKQDSSCRPGITYKLNGSLKKDKNLKLNVDIDENGGDLAKSVVNLKKG